MDSFVEVLPGSDFGISNLPWGVFSTSEVGPRIGVAIGDYVLDVKALSEKGLLSAPALSPLALQQEQLNLFMSCGQQAWREARATIQRLLSSSEGRLRDDIALREQVLIKQEHVQMHLPATVGDYTDFYTSKHHASNVGAMFRTPDKALQENWLHLPVGYHGRASSIVVSGTPVRRPRGQASSAAGAPPALVACRALDFELEMAVFIGTGNKLGEAIPVSRAAEHIFGYVLMNDWSARDIQKWECLPLGPFNGKNWVTQISPWIVSPDALEPYMCAMPPPDVPVLPYLDEPGPRCMYDVNVTAEIRPAGWQHGTVVTQSNLNYLYWTFPQMIAHHTIGGCNLRPGDMLGSGTISGPETHERGCMLELTRDGAKPLQIMPAEGNVEEREYIHDGDTVVLRAWCAKEGMERVGFGTCEGLVLPSLPL